MADTTRIAVRAGDLCYGLDLTEEELDAALRDFLEREPEPEELRVLRDTLGEDEEAPVVTE